jgi:hypothetical protein
MASAIEYRRRLVAKEFFVDCDIRAAYQRVYHTQSKRAAQAMPQKC